MDFKQFGPDDSEYAVNKNLSNEAIRKCFNTPIIFGVLMAFQAWAGMIGLALQVA